MSKIDDIAQEANVSVSTVSKALNNYDDISQKTKERILEIAESLNYTKAKKTGTAKPSPARNIGYICSTNSDENKYESNLTPLYFGVVKTCEKYGYEPIVLNTDSIKQSTRSIRQICADYNLAGVIMYGLRITDPYYEEVLTLKTPCAVLDLEIIALEETDLQNDMLTVVTTDTFPAIDEVVNLLYQKNHRNIGFISGGNDAEIFVVREQAFIKAMKRRNLEYHEEYMMFGSDDDTAAYNQTKYLLTLHPEITAIFATADYLAIGVYRAAAELGRKIPDDLAVVGYDGIAISEFLTPPLTTIKQDFRRMSQTGVESVIKKINGQETKQLCRIPYKFIIRGSV